MRNFLLLTYFRNIKFTISMKKNYREMKAIREMQQERQVWA